MGCHGLHRPRSITKQAPQRDGHQARPLLTCTCSYTVTSACSNPAAFTSPLVHSMSAILQIALSVTAVLSVAPRHHPYIAHSCLTEYMESPTCIIYGNLSSCGLATVQRCKTRLISHLSRLACGGGASKGSCCTASLNSCDGHSTTPELAMHDIVGTPT